ncbi:MAG: anti-sigma factor [Candidatus Eremiobacteraeota bacterium]|nr:anti-sigma factor [Candidatus Eremiobacteraeota bacterium]
MIPHDDAMLDLVAAHALGAVDDQSEECATVHEHLQTCEVCREEYRIASAAAAAVGLSAAQAPPPQLRERILRSLPPRAKAGRVVPLRRTRPWLIAAAAAAIVVFWWTSQHPTSRWTASCVPGAIDCHASGVVSIAAPGRMHLEVSGLAPLPRGKAYQAWVIVPGSAPRPEPIVQVNSQGKGSVDIPFTPPKGTIVALTVESARGSLQPTSKPFLTAIVN